MMRLNSVPVRIAGMLFVCGATTAACATGGSGPAPSGGTSTRALPTGATGGSRSGIGLELTARAEGQSATFAADAGAVYAALVASYEALKIPMTRQDAASRSLGNDGLKMRRQIGKIELRRALDCGGTPGMPNSETYEITASITSTVTSTDPGSSTVTTTIDANGANPGYPGSGVRCSSAGTIEDAIAKEVRTRLSAR